MALPPDFLSGLEDDLHTALDLCNTGATDEGLKGLIEQGKDKGFLTYTQVNEFLPDDASGSSSTSVRRAAVGVLGLVSDVIIVYNYDRDGNTIPVGEPVKRTYGADEYEFYFQDTWKLRPNLTVMGGLRYSLYSPPWEVNGLQVSPTIPLADSSSQSRVASS